MENIFLHLFNMSITAGWIALGVIVLRLLLRKAPRWITVALWGLVGLRLILPFSIESVLSLIPSAETVPPEIIYAKEPMINSGVSVLNNTVNPILSDSLAPSGEMTSVNPIQIVLFIASVIWIAGMASMAVYTLVSYLRIRHKVRVSIPYDKGICLCDSISTPFILGIIKPRIYLPSGISDEDAEYVIAHEKAHLKRLDHLIKPLGFLLLTVYWFNPLLWVAYVLLCRDIELACDEKVIRDMNTDTRKEYSTALLNCSIPRRMIAACPLAFGEVGVKQRIKTVLSYKKPAFWISVVAVALCIALSVGFLTNPVSDPYGTKVTDRGSDVEGVSLELQEIKPPTKDSGGYIRVRWKNRSGVGITCGEPFTLYKKLKSGQWEDIRYGDATFVSIGYSVPSMGSFTHNYGLWDIVIDEEGTYKFQSTFHKDKGDTFPTEYKAWIEFKVTKIPDKENSMYTAFNSGSDREGISAEILSINTAGTDPYIQVMWTNRNDYDITATEEFYICKFDESYALTDCRKGDYAWNDIGYIVPKNGGYFIHKYSLKDIDMTEQGRYRFEGIFSSKGERVWVDFYYPATDMVATENLSGSAPLGISGEVTSVIQIPDEDADWLSSKSNLTVNWHNTTGKELYTVKEYFRLSKNENGTWVDMRAMTPLYYTVNDVAVTGDSIFIAYNLEGVKIMEKGEYKLEAEFRTKPDKATGTAETYTAWIQFSVSDREQFTATDPEYVIYYCNNSEDIIKPSVRLSTKGKQFQFVLSGLSSNVPTGTFRTEGDKLILTTDLEYTSKIGGEKYVFRVLDDKRLQFIADESEDIPKYRYSRDEAARHPFEDGAVFERQVTDGDTSVIVQGYDDFGYYLGEDHSLTAQYILDTADADIDSDGNTESLQLRCTNTSGVFSFIISVFEDGEERYRTTYQGEVQELSFDTDEDGSVVLVGKTQEATHRYDIRLADGDILLSENGKPFGIALMGSSAEKFTDTVSRYLEALKGRDLDAMNACLSSDNKLTEENVRSRIEHWQDITDCELQYLTFIEYSEDKALMNVTYSLTLGDSDSSDTAQSDSNLIRERFTVELEDNEYLITMQTPIYNTVNAQQFIYSSNN